MARTYTVESSPAALSASGTKSLILVNPTNTFVLTELSVSFNASAASAGVLFDLYRTTTLGSPTGSTATFVRSNNSSDQPATSTGLVNLTAEPTAVELIRSWYFQPFGGLYVFQFPLGREPMMSGTSANRIGLRYTGVTGVTPSCVAYFEVEE
jgi:hypothetical protein